MYGFGCPCWNNQWGNNGFDSIWAIIIVVFIIFFFFGSNSRKDKC